MQSNIGEDVPLPALKNPFFHVQLPLRPPDATAALEREPGVAAPHSPLLRNGHHTAFNYVIIHCLMPWAAVLLNRIMKKAQLSVEPFFICWESWQVCGEQKETAGEEEGVVTEHSKAQLLKENSERGCIVGSLGTDTPFWLPRIRRRLRRCISSLHASAPFVKLR